MTPKTTIFPKKRAFDVPFRVGRFRRGSTIFYVFCIIATFFNFCATFSFQNASPNAPILTSVFGTENRLFGQETAPPRAPQTGQVVFFSIPIAVDSAPVYSGPDENAYRTGVVAKRRFVEVYFRTENGWCAIRPPQGSFSWVNAKFVRLESATEGRVVSSGGKAVPARVGAATVEKSSIVQVGLKSNQKLKIVDKTTAQNGSVWYKISPPPGEFRWIRDESLLADPALAKLPTKLTFQAEFLADLERQELANAQTSLTPSLSQNAQPNQNQRSPQTAQIQQTDQNAFANPISGAAEFFPGDVAATLDATEFKKQAIALNADVFQALQNPATTGAELALLASRAEYLFDAAPNDSERFGIQTIYDAIKIAERQKAAASGTRVPDGATPETIPTPSDGVSAPNGSTFDGAPLYLPELSSNPTILSKPTTPAVFPQSNKQPNTPVFANFGALDETALFNQNKKGVSLTNTELSNGLTSPKTTQPKKNRLAFAFSNENNPFRFSKETEIADLSSHSLAKMNENGTNRNATSKLPPLFPSKKQLIVPPSNYRTSKTNQTLRQNAKLVAANEQKKNVKPNESTQNAELAQNVNSTQPALTAQKKELAQPSSNDEFLKTQNARWRAVVASESKASTSGAIVPASAVKSSNSANNRRESKNNEKKSPESPRFSASKIRQASDFQPIATSASTIFDAEGTLAILSNASNGTPKFALVRPNGDQFDVVRYLESGDGVSLEKYLGQKIGVQGLNGTVVVDGTSRKLTIVRSIFPIR